MTLRQEIEALTTAKIEARMRTVSDKLRDNQAMNIDLAKRVVGMCRTILQEREAAMLKIGFAHGLDFGGQPGMFGIISVWQKKYDAKGNRIYDMEYLGKDLYISECEVIVSNYIQSLITR